MNNYPPRELPTRPTDEYFLPPGHRHQRPLIPDPHATKGLFVGDLSFFCTERDLHSVFCEFGNITCVEIKRGRHGDSLLHGFVEYDSEMAAYAALQAMQGRKLKGRRLRFVPCY